MFISLHSNMPFCKDDETTFMCVRRYNENFHTSDFFVDPDWFFVIFAIFSYAACIIDTCPFSWISNAGDYIADCCKVIINCCVINIMDMTDVMLFSFVKFPPFPESPTGIALRGGVTQSNDGFTVDSISLPVLDNSSDSSLSIVVNGFR